MGSDRAEGLVFGLRGLPDNINLLDSEYQSVDEARSPFVKYPDEV